MNDQRRQTAIGLLRRTGTAQAELRDAKGALYRIDFAAMADKLVGPLTGPELCREVFEGRPMRKP